MQEAINELKKKKKTTHIYISVECITSRRVFQIDGKPLYGSCAVLLAWKKHHWGPLEREQTEDRPGTSVYMRQTRATCVNILDRKSHRPDVFFRDFDAKIFNGSRCRVWFFRRLLLLFFSQVHVFRESLKATVQCFVIS